MSDIELDYEYLTQNALRQVVVDALKITAELGAAPGDHHFYIEFATGADGVSIPDTLKAAYPDRMTIVLQHQFNDLHVDDELFSVTLSFDGKPSSLKIPFAAVTSFADPSVQFGLNFGIEDAPPLTDQNDERASDADAQTSDHQDTEDSLASDSGDVVSLDAFRKK